MPDTEPTLAHLQQAAEAVRQANHAAPNAAVVPAGVYDRVAALVTLLQLLQQTTEHLAVAARDVTHLPGLESTDNSESTAVGQAAYCVSALRRAREQLKGAATAADIAGMALSTLYIAVCQNEEG